MVQPQQNRNKNYSYKQEGLYKKFIKRPMDFLFSLISIILLSPVFLVVAILVKTQLGSPIIFKQERPGLNEKIFTMYKFRSMMDAKDVEGNFLSDDMRLTTFGKILRSTSLDELPGLFNIIKGDMSIIGPRPLAVIYLDYYNEDEKHRHDVRPGLSGLAQINGRSALQWEDRFAYDLNYISNITFEKDLKILFLTLLKVFKREGVVTRGTGKNEDFHIYRKQQKNGG